MVMERGINKSTYGFYFLFAVVNAALVALLWFFCADTVLSLYHKAIATGLSFNTTYVLLVLIVLVIEVCALGWRSSSLYRLIRFGQTTKTDIACWLIHAYSLHIYIMAFFSFGLYFGFEKFLEDHLSLGVVYLVDSYVLQIFLCWLAIDFVEYFYHRLAHSVAFMWEAHKFHHAATEFNVITGARVHVLELIARKSLILTPLLIVGTPIEVPLFIFILRKIIDLLQHSMVDWDYGWIGRWVIYSPVGHRIHHSKEKEHWDKNFGDISPMWDRVFGTWYDGGRVNNTVGVSNNNYNENGFIKDYADCYSKTVAAFVHSISTGRWAEREKV